MSNVRCEILRDGITFAQPRLYSGSSLQVGFVSDAEIKMTFRGKMEIPDGVDFINDTMRLYWEHDGAAVPFGHFIITDPEENGTERSLTGFDLTYKAKLSAIENRIHFGAGTKYLDAVRRLLVESGISNIFAEPSDAVFPTDREDWTPGTSRLSICNDLLREINYAGVWMDLDGVVRLESVKQPAADTIRFSYRDGDGVILPEIQKSFDTFGIPNVFIVEVDNPDYTEPMRAESVNDNPASPISVIQRKSPSRIPYYEKLDNIASPRHLQAYADNLRLTSQLSTENITFQTNVEGGHGLFNTLALYHKNATGIYTETEWTAHFLDGSAVEGTMDHVAKRVLYL